MQNPRSDFRGITDMYMDTAAYNLDPSFNYYLQDPRELDQRRLRAYKYYMDFYEGRQWDDVVGSLTTSEWNPAYGYYYSWQEDFNRRTWNVTRNIVDKLVVWMCQEEWKCKVPVELLGDDSDPTKETNPTASLSNNPTTWQRNTDPDKPLNAQELLENFWTINKRMELTYDTTYAACITGDAYIKLAWDPDFYSKGVGELTLQVLDSRTVIPYWDSHDKRKMIGCRIQYPTKQVQDDGSHTTAMYMEVHTEEQIVELVDGDVVKSYPNPLGEIMIVHIPNEPLPYRKYGRSDLESLLIPQKELNEKTSDFSEILAYHAAPVTIIKGARVQTLERGARKIWGGIPKDGDVYNLGLDSDLSSALQYLELLKKHLHESGNVPEEALGSLQNVSNTSAAALHVQYQPLIERINKKQIYFGRGYKRISELVLKFYEAAGEWEVPEGVTLQKRYYTEIEWGDAMPRDRTIQLADLSTELGLMIESKKGAMQRLGVEAPEKKLEEIRQEQIEDTALQYQTAGMFEDPQDLNSPGAMSGGDPQNDVSGAIAQSKTSPVNQGNQVAQQAVRKSAQTTLDNT
jgi:hypothetical protein